ncbi:hypothetical protein JHD48_10410 [Sulfurimonas sp. SAG-AH-194-I05]|nr:hypothetical protein [Sulfurimonas sp. SAG-AH-194-I05]MDF1876144.1 hypothetical protein [Sulfurimonas sp. SAG-AH-194-I05]
MMISLLTGARQEAVISLRKIDINTRKKEIMEYTESYPHGIFHLELAEKKEIERLRRFDSLVRDIDVDKIPF